MLTIGLLPGFIKPGDFAFPVLHHAELVPEEVDKKA
jgi:hypothetical protein